MTIDKAAVIGLDFFPALNALTIASWSPKEGVVFGTFDAPEPRSFAKQRAIKEDVRTALMPHVDKNPLVVIGQCYAGINDDEIYEVLVEACSDMPSELVRHHKLVTHFAGIHTMSRNEFVMEHMRKSSGSRFGEVYADALRRYGCEVLRPGLRSVS